MIRSFIFDLDGTLVQTEKLKALSYARAAIDLCPDVLEEETVIEAFKSVVGLPRSQVARQLVDRFDLTQKASERLAEFGVSRPWQAFVQVRLGHYNRMLSDANIIRQHEWPHNTDVLTSAREAGCLTGLATMSRCESANYVLSVLGLEGAFDYVATRDDVEHGKPDPEIYELVASELDTPPDACLVLEDSPSGIQAAVVAGMWCIAVTTPFTREGVHAQGLLEDRWIVDDPAEVLTAVKEMLDERQRD